jgi:hypothetical protein
MSTLLYDLKANRIMNRTFFTHHLKVYDNNMVLERRRLPFHKEETTISYSHVSQVNLIKDLFFAHLEIINTGGVENILIRYVGKKKGKDAKNIIDAKIHVTHGAYAPHRDQGEFHQASHADQPGGQSSTEQMIDDKALLRYKDLLNQGRLSKIEYNRLLNKHLAK